MKDRINKILNAVQESLTGDCCNQEEKSLAGYEYECKRCGLVLEFNRNQPDAKCPNDGSTMYRVS